MDLKNAVNAAAVIKYRDRIESVLDKSGFDERTMNSTTRRYCARQAAMVACEMYGYSEEYAALSKRCAENSQLSWLPHI
jgi:hypothetical protein